MKKDYYKILGVDKESTPHEIKNAYRKLSKKHHPDVSGDGDDMFKDISEAYSVLSDKDKKSKYDNQGSFNPFGSGEGSAGFGFEDLFGGMGGFNFDDLFGRSSQSNSNINRPGSDIKITIDLTLDELETGSSRKIKYKRKENCSGCNGIGGDDEKTCMSCNGAGRTVHTSRTPMGIMQQQIICNNCGGTGKIIINKCKKCDGVKYEEVTEELDIDIPIGVSDTVLYKYTNKGHSNRYGSGNLLVHFDIKQHRYFIKQGKDLIFNIKIPFNTLISGGVVSIKGLNDKSIKVNIPYMTKPGNILRIKGKGLSNPDNILDKGDIILKIDVEFPNEVNEEELEIVSKLSNKPNFIYNQK